MEKYKISVIVPIYNVEEYLEKCLDSIVNQTYRNLEIILVDDGSSDNSLNICKHYEKIDTRILVIHKENAGLVAARKTGIWKATGDYIAFVDGDDWIENNAYEMIIKESDYEDVLMFGLQEDYEYKVVEKKNRIDVRSYQEDQIEEIMSKMLCDGIFYEFGVLPNLVCKLIKASLLQKIVYNISDEVTIGEDAIFSYSAISRARTVRNINVAPYHYFQRGNSMVRKITDSKCILALYNDLVRIKVPQRLEEQWKRQVYVYMAFILQLKRTDEFVKKMPFYTQLQGKKVMIYGAGNYGTAVSIALSNNMFAQIVGIADRDYQKIRKETLYITAPKDIIYNDFDILYIGILNEKICESVQKQLSQIGIRKEKILYYKIKDVKANDIRRMLEEL